MGDGQVMLGASLQVGAEACRVSRRGHHSCGPHCQSTVKARPACTEQPGSQACRSPAGARLAAAALAILQPIEGVCIDSTLC